MFLLTPRDREKTVPTTTIRESVGTLGGVCRTDCHTRDLDCTFTAFI
jgi:hypothetical protein